MDDHFSRMKFKFAQFWINKSEKKVLRQNVLIDVIQKIQKKKASTARVIYM